MTIVELTTDDEFQEAYAVMKELRTHLTTALYTELLAEMRPRGYRMFAVRDGGQIVALAGVTFATNLYYQRYLWVFDLITTEAGRSHGHGKALIEHLEELARNAGCDTIALSSSFPRVDAHRFYEEKVSFERSGYTFKKELD
ncbi:MAG TPA: GNAT family N-acetyltransferase [Actinomycetota bacterium]|nr:GNAT family N-acetyltransferase [Actinomycetota bacterium]